MLIKQPYPKIQPLVPMLTKNSRAVCRRFAPTVITLTVILSAPAHGQEAVVERRTVAMGTELVARVAASDSQRAEEAVQAAFRAVRSADDLLSTWRPEAALARANRAPVGEAVPLEGELAVWLTEAAAWSRWTHGAFDPAIGALVTVWDLRGVGRVPTEAALERALRATGMDCLAWDPRTGALVRHDSLAWIDSGGFGKGAALRAAADSLHAAGITDGLVNFGGQLLVLGRDPAGRPWEVAVAHPAERGTAVARLRVASASVATTAQSERFVVAAGDTLGHVLDPRAGRPVPAWGSVTVVHGDPMVADILSTALFVMGPEAGMHWLAGRHDVAALFLVLRADGLAARWNPQMASLLTERSW